MIKITLLSALVTSSAFASDINHLVDSASKKYGVDSNLVHAVIKAESGYNPKAYSSAGAAGLMQLMPETAKRYGVSTRFDPAQSIDGGTHYLKDLLTMFDGNVHLAVAGYNAGEGAVMKYGNRIPPYSETQTYVKRVISNMSGKYKAPNFKDEPVVAKTNNVRIKSKFINMAAYNALSAFYSPKIQEY